MTDAKRRNFNERFVQRLLARRPQDRPRVEAQMRQMESAFEPGPTSESHASLEAMRDPREPGNLRTVRDLALETIVSRERPVLFVRDGALDFDQVTMLGPEAVDLVGRMRIDRARVEPLLPLIGRIDVLNFPGGAPYLGTAWFIDTDIVVTNRHVAALVARWDGRRFAFVRGTAGTAIEASFCNAHEFDDLVPDASRVFPVTDVLYIEPANSPIDIAFLRVKRRTDGIRPPYITVASTDAADERFVCTIGYPARAQRNVIPDQNLMQELYRDRYDVKRVAPGYTSGERDGSMTHDCTTLGGNSGSVVVDMSSGEAVGLHYAGLYEEDNFAVRASVLSDYFRRKRWTSPSITEGRAPPSAGASNTQPAPSPPSAPAPAVAAATGQAATTAVFTVPLTLSISIGQPVMVAPTDAGGGRGLHPSPSPSPAPAPTPGPAATVTVEQAEAAAAQFWEHRPKAVVAVRVGYLDHADGGVGEDPCIAASVLPSALAETRLGGIQVFAGVPVRYLPADIDEQVQAQPTTESVDSIAYDDAARTGPDFSLDTVEEDMELLLHVGPEYSWDVLKDFIDGAQGRLVSAMYEFHSVPVRDALEARLDAGSPIVLVMDNASFSPGKGDDDFDRRAVFADWGARYPFRAVVAPEGKRGLISDSYHMKVTVRDDDRFWLSSGNWKESSSQPIITQQQRDQVDRRDLPGNREWHVVARSRRLSRVLRNHILQDFETSRTLGGGVFAAPDAETFVDIPVEESLALERRAPGKVLMPLQLQRRVKVRPLLTPDEQGGIYSEAVLELIASAQDSLLFQIPYIGMPPTPRGGRGYIDRLIGALTHKLKTLRDARVLLRSGSSRFSAPTHAAWYFKSKGVDIDQRVAVIDNHHTKGMIVDGRRVLIGSHNWSKPGVTLNRDASLLFDDAEVAAYFREAFEIDWNRSNPVKPRRYEVEAAVREAVGDAPPIGFRRVRLADLAKDD